MRVAIAGERSNNRGAISEGCCFRNLGRFRKRWVGWPRHGGRSWLRRRGWLQHGGGLRRRGWLQHGGGFWRRGWLQHCGGFWRRGWLQHCGGFGRSSWCWNCRRFTGGRSDRDGGGRKWRYLRSGRQPGVAQAPPQGEREREPEGERCGEGFRGQGAQLDLRQSRFAYVPSA